MKKGFYKLKRFCLNLIPDKTYLKLKYKHKMGKKLDLENPQTFNEKMQWLKLYDRNPLYTKLVDKYEVREYIKEKIGEEYLIPLLGVYDNFDDIDFAKLPNQFVIKCTHDSGGLVVCRDKQKLDLKKAKVKINKCLKNNFYYYNREWPYKNVKPRIIIEKYMEDTNSKELVDYKFFCFNGQPKFIYVSEGLENHETAKISFVNMEFEREKFKRTDYKDFETIPSRPKNFEEMKEISKILSHDVRFLRVDLYEINGKVYFGELTFTPCAGFLPFEPKEYDKIIGEWIDLEENKK